jgi:glycosyltransferase involved in cell wall biosynthesis
MRIWVVKTSEMLAEDGSNGRLLRSGLIAHLLDRRGHDVTWWMSTFDHAQRRQRADRDCELPFGRRGRIRMLRSPGYARTISPRRLYDHAVWGIRFAAALRREPAPDAILCAYPTIESAWVCARYGRRSGVPVIIDLRDMWPDILAAGAGARLAPLANVALLPWRVLARAALRDATGLYAITQEFLAWGLQRADRDRRTADGVFPLAYPAPTGEREPAAESFWEQLGVRRDGSFTVAFVGAMNGRSYAMEPVLAAAARLEADGARARFVLCGDGDDLPRLRTLARTARNVLLPGWVTATQVHALLARSQLGLVPYRNTPDLTMSVPNKAAEYFAAGVPVATSLRGTLADVLAKNACGFAYNEEDPATLFAIIVALLGRPADVVALGQRARALYEREYRAEDVYNRMAEQLEGLALAHRVAS